MMKAAPSKQGILQNLRKTDYPLVQLKAMNYVVKNHLVSEDILDELVLLLLETDVYPKICNLTGYTLSEFAYATLFLLEDEVAMERYLRNTPKLSPASRERVYHLIESEYFKYLG